MKNNETFTLHEQSKLYTVIIYVVCGGISKIKSFTSRESACKYFFDWANENNTEKLIFDEVPKALEWFRDNEAELNYTIDFFEYSTKD